MSSSCGCGCSGQARTQTASDAERQVADPASAVEEPATVPVGDGEQPGATLGPVPRLATTIGWRDLLGGWAVRWDIGRSRYHVAPGLYRAGEPEASSPVLVTANYKLTVDAVRRSFAGLDVWLLVLDTDGVNVWCAAGKGTFGTEELVRRIAATRLAERVSHRHIVLPQLGATGVAAHEVKRATGFLVHYGPVLARDIPAYLAAGLDATPAMRRVPFGWWDRLVVAPVEIVRALKPLLGFLAAVGLLDLVRHGRLTSHLAADFAPFAGAALTGAVLVPLLLPWLPFRAFVLKGAVAGAVWAAASLALWPAGWAESIGTALLVVAIVSFMAMMFTGSTTFTTFAGARLEVRRGGPVLLATAVTGAAVRMAAAFL
jgi:hypothetical protein